MRMTGVTFIKLEKYIEKGGKKLRYGYTTGSCATGASKAAALMLVTGHIVHEVEIDTPKGWTLTLSVEDAVIEADRTAPRAHCCVVKDAGDDPDVTDGMKICATVTMLPAESGTKAMAINASKGDPRADRVQIDGGVGVGRATRPGLSVDVGEAAINPVPRAMIMREVIGVLPEDIRVQVIISAPEGAIRAQKTFNPKLGIEGGISIIGTSGIVEPMSEEALKHSMALELSMLKAQGARRIIFSPGNYGRDFGLAHALDERVLIKTSNYIGFMIDEAVRNDIETVLYVGHIGKLIKVAAGIFNTHSHLADGRMETLAAHAALAGAPQTLIAKIMASNTTEEAVDYIFEMDFQHVFDAIAEKIKAQCVGRAGGKIAFETLMFSLKHGILGQSNGAGYLLEAFRYEEN